MKKILSFLMLLIIYSTTFTFANPNTVVNDKYFGISVFENTSNIIEGKMFQKYKFQNPSIFLSTDGYTAKNPKAAVNDENTIIVVWEAFDGVSNYIQAKIYDPINGWSNIHNLTQTDEIASNPSIAISSDKIMIVWEIQNGAIKNIQGKFYEEGSFSDTYAISDVLKNSKNPKASINKDDKLCIIWLTEDNSNQIIQAKIHDQINGWSAIDDLTTNTQSAANINVISSNDGYIDIVWQTTIQDVNQIYRKIHDDISGWSPKIAVSDVLIDSRNPQISTSPSNKKLITWETYVSGKYALVSKIYDPYEKVWGNELPVSDPMYDAQNHKSIFTKYGYGLAIWEEPKDAYKVIKACYYDHDSGWSKTIIQLSDDDKVCKNPSVCYNPVLVGNAVWSCETSSIDIVEGKITLNPNSWSQLYKLSE